ncbi:MAG: hypothetical protein ACYSX1_08960, partial [Planctomycetota bacterium]
MQYEDMIMEPKKANNQHISAFFVIVSTCCFLSTLPRVGSSATGEQARQVWDRIFTIREAQREMIESIEVRYSFKRLFASQGETHVDMSKQCAYGREGVKHYQLETFQDKVTGVDGSHEQAYDGTMNRSRHSGRKNAMTLSHSEKPLPTPAPADLCEIYKPADLNMLLEKELIKLLSAENVTLDKTKCVKLVFDITEGNMAQTLEVLYDTEHGYWPVASKRFDESQGRQLVDQISDVKLQAVVSAGNTYYYPIAATREIFTNGQSMGSDTFAVDNASLKINIDIPDRKFVLDLRPEDNVYDTDLKIALRDQGKDLDVLSQIQMLADVSLGDNKS